MNIQNSFAGTSNSLNRSSKANFSEGLSQIENLSSSGLGSDFAAILNASSNSESTNSLESGVAEDGKLRETFNNFVGQTFFGQLLSSMRSTQNEAAYFNGGRAEKIFQGQLDQVLSEELSESSASQIADPMFKLFQANRNG